MHRVCAGPLAARAAWAVHRGEEDMINMLNLPRLRSFSPLNKRANMEDAKLVRLIEVMLLHMQDT